MALTVWTKRSELPSRKETKERYILPSPVRFRDPRASLRSKIEIYHMTGIKTRLRLDRVQDIFN